jgi:A/G-specific adenine glycosylase
MVHQTDHAVADSLGIRRRLLRGIGSTSAICRGGAPEDPYRIWISEIMLQQTRVAAVIPYYERFLALFPDAARWPRPPSRICWRRGPDWDITRARATCKRPRALSSSWAVSGDYAALRELPGVGDYTAAAVASIAFGRPHAVLDGNVLRVLEPHGGGARRH